MRAGFEAASTNDITAGFRGSKATLFRHFPSKQALIGAVVARIATRWRARVDMQSPGELPPRAWLTEFATQALDWILSPDVLFVGRLGIAEGHKLPDLTGIFDQTAGAPLRALLAERLSAWTEAGLLRCDNPSQDAEHFLDLAMAGAVSRALYGAGKVVGPTRADFVERVVDLFLDGRGTTSVR